MLDWKFKFKFLFELFAFNFFKESLSIAGHLKGILSFIEMAAIESMKGNVNVIWSGF